MYRILVVEDDHYLRRDLKAILGQNGYDIQTAATYTEAMNYVLNDSGIDLYLLDVWLPDRDGFELCAEIRKRNGNPILFLTACDDENSIVKGLNLGGDDYITKPFRSAELMSRVKANLRRITAYKQSCILVCKDLEVDEQAGIARLSGKELELRPTEMRLLLLLMKQPGKLVQRRRILDCLSEETDEPIEDNSLSVQMSRLRGKIGSEYIETIRGMGYRFCADVKEKIGG